MQWQGAKWLGIAAGVAALLFGDVAWAAPSPAGFTISPASQNIEIKQGMAEAQYTLKITNHTNYDQNFRVSMVDFGALDEEGGVAFLGTPTSELEHKYGLASWMRPESDILFAPIGQTASVVVHIDNRASLGPGGHYGAVLLTAVTDTGQIGVNGHVGIKQVLASLVLAVKEGGAQRMIGLKSQRSNGNFWRLPTLAEERFDNAGNVHATPRGVVSVVDPWGKVVVRGALNEQSGVILPESIRRFKTPLVGVARAWLPGRYKIVTEYRDADTNELKTGEGAIWYVGGLITWAVLIFGLAVLVLAGWLGWLWWRKRRRHKSRKK